MKPDLSVIIPTYNRNDVFFTSLSIIYEAIKPFNIEVIVVNDSKTNEVEIPKHYQDRVSLYKNPKSGVAAARNFGRTLAKADLLLFIDDDMNVSAENIRHTLLLFKQYPTCCLNLNWEYPPDLLKKLSQSKFGRYMQRYELTSLKGWMGRGSMWRPHTLIKADGIASYYLAIPAQSFDASQGYNEHFPFAGFEDFDFSKRLLATGIEAFIDTRSTVYHNEFDRTEIQDWLQRRYRTGVTQKVAVTKIGYTDRAIQHPPLKAQLYLWIHKQQRLGLRILNMIPNIRLFDFISFACIRALEGAAIYAGYTEK